MSLLLRGDERGDRAFLLEEVTQMVLEGKWLGTPGLLEEKLLWLEYPAQA